MVKIYKKVLLENIYKKKYIIENFQSTMNHLINANLIEMKEKNIFFRHDYVYYYCIGEYLSEPKHYKENEKIINEIINNLHIIRNAYTTTFLAHHLRTIEFLDEIKLNAMVLFENFEEIKLNRQEIDNYGDILKEPSKINFDTNKDPNIVRERKLQTRDKDIEVDEIEEKIDEDISKRIYFCSTN